MIPLEVLQALAKLPEPIVIALFELVKRLAAGDPIQDAIERVITEAALVQGFDAAEKAAKG